MLSSTNTTITQPSQTQQPSPRNYDPPPLPSQYSIHTTPHNFPQQVSSNTNDTNTLQVQPAVQFQTTAPTRQIILQTLAYITLKIHKHKIYNLVQPSILFIPIHYLITLPLETFLGFHYKPFQLTHYHVVLQVQIPKYHNTLQQVIFK